jgi:hypothetical protein
MTNEMKQVLVKSVATQTVGIAVGLYINKAIDNKLAKSEDPGCINRGYRKMLKFSRNPYVIAANVALIVFSSACVQAAKETEV